MLAGLKKRTSPWGKGSPPGCGDFRRIDNKTHSQKRCGPHQLIQACRIAAASSRRHFGGSNCSVLEYLAPMSGTVKSGFHILIPVSASVGAISSYISD